MSKFLKKFYRRFSYINFYLVFGLFILFLRRALNPSEYKFLYYAIKIRLLNDKSIKNINDFYYDGHRISQIIVDGKLVWNNPSMDEINNNA